MSRERINKLLNQIPTHVIILLTILIWIVPTLGLLVTSLRPPEAVRNTGWWTVFRPQTVGGPYAQYCAECHGDDGTALPQADLTDPELIAKYPRSLQLLALLRRDINGQPHMGDQPLPSPQEAADIAAFLRQGEQTGTQFTLDNYIDALVGYRGQNNYRSDCAAGTQPPDLRCNLNDILNPRGMGRAFVNSLFVTLPATILPILFAAFAGYAFAWLDFKGRFLLFALHALGWITGYVPLFGAAGFQTLIRYMEIVALYSLFMSVSSSDQPGTDFTMLACAQLGVYLVGSLCAGMLADALGYGVLFSIAAALSAFAVLLTARMLRRV